MMADREDDWALLKVRNSGAQIGLSERLANILDLPRHAKREQIAARIAALDHKPPPRRAETCELLAAIALLGDEVVDGYRHLRGVKDPELLLIGPGGDEIVQELLEQLGPLSERELAEDLALTDAEFLVDVPNYVANYAAEAVRIYLASLLDTIVHEAWSRGWLRRDPPPSSQEVALKKLAKRRAKLAKRQGQSHGG